MSEQIEVLVLGVANAGMLQGLNSVLALMGAIEDMGLNFSTLSRIVTDAPERLSELIGDSIFAYDIPLAGEEVPWVRYPKVGKLKFFESLVKWSTHGIIIWDGRDVDTVSGIGKFHRAKIPYRVIDTRSLGDKRW